MGDRGTPLWLRQWQRQGWRMWRIIMPPEHGRTVHCEPHNHGPVYRYGAAPWIKGFHVEVVTRVFGSGGCMGVGEGRRYGRGRLIYW